MQGRVLILAGGGGHTSIAYALAQALHGKMSLAFLAPEGDTWSKRRLSKFGEVQFLIKPRGPTTPSHTFAFRLVKAFKDSAGKAFHEFDVVVSTGTNFCILPALFAWTRGVPVVNIESLVRFTRPSRTSRLLQPISTITALQWKEQRKLLKGVVVGPTLSKLEVEPWNGGYILVSGGTYGHKLLFDTVAESKLSNVVMQTGRIDPRQYIKNHPEWKVITFTENFDKLLAGAELVVAHFGQTVLNAVVYGKPVVMVLNPEWTRTVGIEDAKYLAKKANAVLVSDINLGNILEAMNEARKREVPTLPDGAENLASRIFDLLHR